jgi:hypothetical protein
VAAYHFREAGKYDLAEEQKKALHHANLPIFTVGMQFVMTPKAAKLSAEQDLPMAAPAPAGQEKNAA